MAHNKELDMVVGAELRYMDLSDTTRTQRSIDLGGRIIRNITLEPEGGSIYWVRIVDTRSVIIERFFPNNGTILSVHSATAGLAGLACLKKFPLDIPAVGTKVDSYVIVGQEPKQ